MLICGNRIRFTARDFTMFSIKLLAGAALALGITAASANAQVVVSSKIDTEGTLLGNVIVLALNANGIKTQDKVALGTTPVLRLSLIHI